MEPKQGDLALLDHPLAQELLHAPIPARLAYVWTDGTPRVNPVWFHWTEKEIVVGSAPNAPKMKALADGTKVALVIDYEQSPARALQVRGTVRCELIDGEMPEYAGMARRYVGEEMAKVFSEQFKALFPQTVRIAITPESVGLMDMANGRVPSAWAQPAARTAAGV